MANTPLDWQQPDAIALRNYLGSSKLLDLMRRSGPVVKGETMEHRAMTGSELKGWNDAIDFLINHQRDPVPVGPDNAGFIPADETDT